MADISPALAEYLASLRKRKWEPGKLDCVVFMADWVAKVCGCDPIADVRGTYSTEKQYLRIMTRQWPLLSSFDEMFQAGCAARLTSVGYVPTPFPQTGDLMTVFAPYSERHGRFGSRPVGAICVSAKMRAVITSDLGVVIADNDRLPMIRAWTLPHG